MAKYDYPHLCGGTFFTLLLQAIKQRLKARDRQSGGNDGLSDTNVLIGLIRVAQPQYIKPAASTFAQNTSEYKACRIAIGTYLPFNDAAFTTPFDMEVKTNYAYALAAMSGFVNSFVDTGNFVKCERLIKALLELIEADESISDRDLLYICPNGQPLEKAVICSLADICFPSFLLGVWHYIVMNRADNSVGRRTFMQWHKAPEMKGQRWRFISNIGDGIHHINITVDDDTEPEAATAANEPFVEGANEEASVKASQADNNQFVQNQFGNNNVQISKAEEMYSDILFYLEGKRVLYNPRELEVVWQCIESVNEIKHWLDDSFRGKGFNRSELAPLLAMKKTCNAFLDNSSVQKSDPAYFSFEGWSNPAFGKAMKAFRDGFRNTIRIIEAEYGLKFNMDIPREY